MYLEGGTVKYTEILEPRADLLLLSRLLDFGGLNLNNAKTYIIDESIKKLIIEGKEDQQSLIRNIKHFYFAYMEKPKLVWYCVFPINIKSDCLNHKRWFSINNYKFVIRKWSTIFNKYDYENWFKESKYLINNDILKSKFVPLEIKVQERNFQAAYHIAESNFNHLCALLNFPVISFRPQIKFGFGKQKLRNEIVPPPTSCVFDINFQNPKMFFELTILNKYDDVNVSIEHFHMVEKLDKKLRTKDRNELIELAYNCLNFYNFAFNSLNTKETFMILWQACEIITLNPKRNFLVVNNIKKLLCKEILQLHDYVDFIYEIRNTYVHEGLFPEDDEMVINIIKSVVENSFAYLIELSKVFSTRRQLEIYYQVANTENSISENEKIILKYLQN